MQKNRQENFGKFLNKYGIFIIFLIFILATADFFYRKSFDHLEISYLKISQFDIKRIIFENWGDQLPVWFMLAKFYVGIFGASEISLKILSVGIFLLSAFVLYKLCEIYGLNKYLITLSFLFNPLLLAAVVFTFKHWSFLILVSLLALYLFEKYKDAKSKKYLFFLFLAIFAGIYSNLVFLIFFCSFAVYVFISLLLKQISFKFFIVFVIMSLILGLPFLYYYEKANNILFNIQGGSAWGTEARNLDFLKESLSAISGIDYLDNLNEKLAAVLIFLFILFFIFQFFLIREKKFIFLKTWMILTVFSILIVMMFMTGRTPVSGRYYALAVPFFYLAIFPKTQKKRISVFALSVSIIIFILTAFSSWQMAKTSSFDDWRGMASFLGPKLKEDTQILILYRFYEGDVMAEYYLGKPVTQLSGFGNNSGSALYSNDVWIIRRYGDYGGINKLADEYDIKEYKNFEPIKLFHLTKKNPKDNTSLIFNNPLIEIEKNGKTKKVQFSNGSTTGFEYPPLQGWQKIQLLPVKSGGTEKICLFAHPQNNTKINIIYKNINIKEELKITTGISEYMMGKNLSPVYADVYLNNALLKKIIQPNDWGWLSTKIDTNGYEGKSADIKFTIYADNDEKRHFCFDAEITDKNDYFFQNIKSAKSSISNEPCNIYKTEPIFPHNEKRPPFVEAAIYERWDCEDDLISKNRIWNTVGKSYAVSDNEFKEAIWFHPETNKVKTLEYKDINLDIKKISGFYGINDLSMANKINPTLTFIITANGEKIYEDKFAPGKGWKYFKIPFDKKLKNAVFSIATDNDRWNHFFFNAFVE